MFSWREALPLLVFPFQTGCAMSFPEMLCESAADPTCLLRGYGLFASFVFILCLVSGRRGLWWSIIDGICATGVLALALSPIYGWLTHNAFAGVLVGLTGLLSVIGPVILYRWGKDRPIEELFRSKNENEDG